MTEAEWLNSVDSNAMWQFIRDQVTPRKLVLCYVAMCRQSQQVWSGIDVAEEFADKVASRLQDPFPTTVPTVLHKRLPLLMQRHFEADHRQHCELLREILGNPFRPVSIDPAWRTETVVSLAQGIYDERAFDRLPILADALEDAGCTEASMLNHCRQPGVHARGCWPVDLLLSKE